MHAAHHAHAPLAASFSLPQAKESKKAKFKLGVYDPKLGSAIQEATSIPCIANDMVGEVLRGVSGCPSYF